MIRAEGRDLHAEFQTLLPSRPHRIKIQRWSPRRIGLLLLTAAALAVLGKVSYFVLVNNDVTTTPLEIAKLDCGQPEPLWLQAQSVPSASLVPCLNPLPAGWSFNSANVRSGWSTFILDHDRVGSQALIVRLTATCETSGTIEHSTGQPGARRYERPQPTGSGPGATWYTIFPGGCVTAQLHPAAATHAGFVEEATATLSFTSRGSLDQELDRRSNGRLHLDPEQAP